MFEPTPVLKRKFLSAQPFPHLVIENFTDPEFLRAVGNSFPGPSSPLWFRYDSEDEKKLAFNQINKLAAPIKEFFTIFNSQAFADKLGMLTDFDGLTTDPDLHGAGLHVLEPGGYLGVHRDGEIHPKTGLLRRLNLIVFCSEKWDPSDGGSIELWPQTRTVAIKSYPPLFNSAIVFDAHRNYHGCRDFWTAKDRCRKSLAVYF